MIDIACLNRAPFDVYNFMGARAEKSYIDPTRLVSSYGKLYMASIPDLFRRWNYGIDDSGFSKIRELREPGFIFGLKRRLIRQINQGTRLAFVLNLTNFFR
jgi:hypothetical protein